LSHEMIHTSLVLDRRVKVVESRVTDAVTGGCLLSAAELDSSKNYIQINDQWQIAYMVRSSCILLRIQAIYKLFLYALHVYSCP